MTSYPGGVFSPDVEGGRAAVAIHVGAVIRAETPTGRTFELDPSRCELDLGGASGRMWFCRDVSGDLTLFSEAPGLGEALQQVPGLRAQVDTILGQRRSRRQRATLGWTAALAGLVLAFVGAFVGLKAAARAALDALPISVDERLGRIAISSMDLGGPEVRDPVVLQGIDAIVDRLSEHAEPEFDYDVRVVEAPLVNAFALPGGALVVYTGLIREAESAEGLAGVLAHEISHVTLRHGIERIGQSLGIAAAVQLMFGDVGGLSALVIDLVQSGALTSYGRDQERAADAEGMRILHRAGIDPLALAEIFEKLAEEEENGSLALSWLSSHPQLEERIANVRARAEELGAFRARPLELDFAALQARLAAEANAGDSSELDAGDSSEATSAHDFGADAELPREAIEAEEPRRAG